MKVKYVLKSISVVLVVAIFSTILTSGFSNQVPSNNKAVVNANALETQSNNLKSIDELSLAKTETGLGEIGESLNNGYAKLAAACTNNEDLSSAADAFKQLLSSLKAQAIEELNSTDNGTDEYNNYRSSVLSGFKKLEGCISKLSEENYDNTLREIEEIVAPEKAYVGLADDLPFNNVSGSDIETQTYTETEKTNYEPENTNYTQSNLAFTNDVVINDEIRSEFADLSGTLEIYQYIKNNYMPEFYYGSRKGSVGAFEEKSGNDYDLSSLLIAVLRDRNIPSRYVRGNIEITAEQAIEWTAAEDINSAIRIIASLGIPVTALTGDSGIEAVQLEHVWVEAYVPYTDYRGAGNQAGESLWIPLDVSFKELNHLEGVDLTSLTDYLNDENNYITSDTVMNDVNVGEISTVVSGKESALVKYFLENGYAEANIVEAFGGKEIISEDLGYLPLTLPYVVSDKIDSFDDVPLELTDSITFSLVGNSSNGVEFHGSKSISKVLYTPDLYGKRIVLAYTPATDADKTVLEEYGGIFKTPAYLLKLKPQLIIDGEVAAEGSVCNAGYMQKYTINIHSGSPNKNDSSIENVVTVGGMYCIALDYGKISEGELQGISEDIEALEGTVSAENIYTDSAMGEVLNSVAKSYFGQLDIYNTVIAGQKNVAATRDLSIGIVGFNIDVVYTFDRPSELNEGGIFLDIKHDVHSVVSNINNSDDEKAYMLQTGIYASAMEHGVLEQVTGVESVSTIKTLQYAVDNDIPIHIIAKENISTELNSLEVSEQVKNEIRSSVNSGKLVIIPEKEITINQWSGVGYMVLDPDTCACGYMISGGLAGGAMTAGEVITEYILYVVQGAILIVAWEVFKTVALAMTPCGWLGVINMLFIATEVIMLVAAISQMVSLITMYNSTKNVYYLQELLIQVASCATLGIASKLFGNKLAQLKNTIKTAIDEAGLKGTCFVAGTLVSTSSGLVAIENIKAGDIVYSFNEETQEVSEQVVEQTFIHENKKLVHINVEDETITTTPEHPFYVPKKGFVNAVDLQAGDSLWTVNGEYVIIEKVQHEILETPIKVYNFKVANNHTYFVGNIGLGVHNKGTTGGSSGKEMYDADGKYTGGRTPEEMDALADDPAHKGSTRPDDIAKGIHERDVGLGLEEQGKLDGPITRDPSGKAEFFDANGQKWDVKSFNSNYPPKKGGFTVENAMKSINKSLNEGEFVIVDTTNMSSDHVAALLNAITELGLGDKIIWWP